jgi:hypothetical protein
MRYGTHPLPEPIVVPLQECETNITHGLLNAVRNTVSSFDNQGGEDGGGDNDDNYHYYSELSDLTGNETPASPSKDSVVIITSSTRCVQYD